MLPYSFPKISFRFLIIVNDYYFRTLKHFISNSKMLKHSWDLIIVLILYLFIFNFFLSCKLDQDLKKVSDNNCCTFKLKHFIDKSNK